MDDFRDASAVSAERRWLKTAADLGLENDARDELEPFSYTMVASEQVHRRFPRASIGTGSRLAHAEVLADDFAKEHALGYLLEDALGRLRTETRERDFFEDLQRPCLICRTRRRDVALSCNCCVSCSTCARELRLCPRCGKPASLRRDAPTSGN